MSSKSTRKDRIEKRVVDSVDVAISGREGVPDYWTIYDDVLVLVEDQLDDWDIREEIKSILPPTRRGK